MKKIIFFLVLLFFINQTFSANTEEQTCIKQLSKAIEKDVRFNNPNIFKNNKGLKNVLNEKNNSYFDISNYSNFLGKVVINPANTDVKHQNLINNKGFTDKDFVARRTNIATVVTANDFVISNIVGFGKDSNFNFPLSAENGMLPYGDAYNLNGIFFKEYVVYTHHSYAGDFLSCGIVKIKPLSGNTFTSIDETQYKTNVLTGNNCNSSFSGNDIVKNGFTFYKMKTNVCVTDYLDKDLLKMEVISLAYKNNSPYFSDYVAHNLQVQAMKDLTNQSKGLYGIRQIFLRYLDQGTCSKLLHTSTATLPAFCGGTYSDTFNLSGINISDINAIVASSNLIKNNIAGLFDIFLPKADAFRTLKNMDELKEKARGIMVLDSMPYDLYKKLQAIKDDSFRNYLTLAISPNLEDLIKNRRKQGIIVSPYEDTFLKCGINYSERNNIVIDFLKNLKDPKNIDFSNLTYINPKFGNCIVPYPDKNNLNKEIELSFGTNKFLARKINGAYDSPKISDDILKLVEKEKNINIEYEKIINKLTKQFNSNDITGEELNKKLVEEKNIFNSKIEKNFSELNNIKEPKENKINKQIKKQINSDLTDINKKSNNFDRNTLIIIISLILVGFLVLFLSIKRKK